MSTSVFKSKFVAATSIPATTFAKLSDLPVYATKSFAPAPPSASNDVAVVADPEIYTANLQFLVLSQGTARLRIKNPGQTVKIFLNVDQESSVGKPGYSLEVSSTSALFRNCVDQTVLATTTAPTALLEADNEINYWFSIDRKNKKLKYGKGDATENLCLLKYVVPEGTDFHPNVKFIGCNIPSSSITKAKIYELPVTLQLPPFVIANDAITLEQIEAGEITAIGNLPTECQMLYSVVAGNKVELDEQVANAIAASLKNPNGALNKKCVEKSITHKQDILETYLRVTLGQDMGYSPGVPFVLELWPSKHFSPIHSHSDAFAVIKVLHGSIHCSFYSDLNPTIRTPYLESDFSAGQVTYLTPNIYQTHQLKNITEAFTATIQCYRYSNDDTTHYEYFDFLNDENKRDKFVPNSDYTYTSLIDTLRKEGLLPPPPAKAKKGTFLYLGVMSLEQEQGLDSTLPLDKVAPYPAALPGFKRHAIYVQPLANEYDAKVEIIFGKMMLVDGNRHSLGGQAEERTLDGWGYTYLYLEKVFGPRSTMMFCPEPKTMQFVSTQGCGENLHRYNSRLPIVVYAPEDIEVRYRIWRAPETMESALSK
eukprot:gene12642-14850_t